MKQTGGIMFNQNQELEFVTFEGEQTQAALTPFKNKQGEKMNLNLNQPKGNQKLTAKFRLNKNSQIREFVLNGRDAQTLIALVEAKQKGTTALEISSWALRLSAYIFNLRTECGLDIITNTEPHDGGHHGRYILRDEIKILEVFDPKNQQ
jgi:hypothetical protein